MPGPGRLISSLSPTLRAPLAASVIVFLVAVGTTQIALSVASEQADRQIERLSRVYLAGIAESVEPLLQVGDLEGVRVRFREAVASHEGIVERALFIFDADQELTARAGDATLPLEEARRTLVSGFHFEESARLAWADYRSPGSDWVLVAGLDITEIIDLRNRLTFSVVAVDLLLAAVCGLLAYLALRRMNRPLDGLLKTLAASAAGPPKRAPARAMVGADDRVRALYLAYNDLVESVRERERLHDSLAEQEQAAALGRLSATVAHEVRNPLGGLATAVSTLKRFGDDPKVRAESLGFLERGIEALDKIVTSTLNLYRPEDERRLTPVDFADLRRLVAPAADKAGVQLEWSVDLPDTLSVAATGARQVILNLLLNACAVTPRDGQVSLHAFLADDALKCVIRDQGGGMASGHADRLTGDAPTIGATRRLGIDVIVGLLDRLEGRASVAPAPDGGTEVTIAIPVEAADV